MPETLRSEVVDGMRIDWDAPIVMSDGVVLRADVFRPADGGRYPVLMTYGPYGKLVHFGQGAFAHAYQQLISRFPEVGRASSLKYMNWETADPERWVPHGYVMIRVDSRGAGRSEGVLDVRSPKEAEDYCEAIEWAGTQPWSDGNVGLLGISYYANNQWRVASMRPRHLKAICPWEGNSERYRDAARQGGIESYFPRTWYPRQILAVQHGLGERGLKSDINGEWVSGPETLTDSELVVARRDPRLDAEQNELDGPTYSGQDGVLKDISIPLLSAGNWGGHGLHLRGNVEGFLHAGSKEKWLEIHGDAHWASFYWDYGIALQKTFFDHFLKGVDNGWDLKSPVQLLVRHVDKFVEREEEEWPLARTRWIKAHLNAHGGLGAQPEAVPKSVTYDALGKGATFLTAPFDEKTEITGPISVRLTVSSSTKDADLFLVVRLFSPNMDEVVFQGASDPHTPVGQGWLRVSHRKLDPARSLPYRPFHTHDEREWLEPGKSYQVDVEIWPTCIVAPQGYRLALSVRGSDYEYPNVHELPDASGRGFKGCGPYTHPIGPSRPADLFANLTTIHLGAGAENWVLLPIIPAKETRLR